MSHLLLSVHRVRRSELFFCFLCSYLSTVLSHIRPYYLLILSLSFSLTLCCSLTLIVVFCRMHATGLVFSHSVLGCNTSMVLSHSYIGDTWKCFAYDFFYFLQNLTLSVTGTTVLGCCLSLVPCKDRLCGDGTMLDIDNVCSLSVSLFSSENSDGTDLIHVSMENCSESNQINLGFCKGHQLS